MADYAGGGDSDELTQIQKLLDFVMPMSKATGQTWTGFSPPTRTQIASSTKCTVVSSVPDVHYFYVEHSKIRSTKRFYIKIRAT